MIEKLTKQAKDKRDGVIYKPIKLQFQPILTRKIWMIEVDHRTWLHAPPWTLWSTCSYTHQVVEI